jgi:hypothetical protein
MTTYAYIRPYCTNWFDTHDYDLIGEPFEAPREEDMTYEDAVAFPRRPHPDAILVEWDRERALAIDYTE